jgi:hypothetical protein
MATLPFDTADEFAAMAEEVYIPQLPRAEYPYLNESAEALAAAGYDPTHEFAFGLDEIIDALERLRDPDTTPTDRAARASGDT